MKVRYLWIMLLALAFIGCDDNTGALGEDIFPDSDKVSVGANTFSIATNSILVDSVYARTSTAFLGKYTDPDFGSFEADFLTQFNCTDTFKLRQPYNKIVPNTIKSNIVFYYSHDGFFGDSLNACRLSIYELNKVLEGGSASYYTDIDPKDYYDVNSQPLAQKAYSVRDPSISDSLWHIIYPYVQVNLPQTLGERIVDLTDTNPEYFKDSETFVEKVFKGIYVKADHGDGTILYIDKVSLIISADVYVDSLGFFPIKRRASGYGDQDSINYNMGLAQFSATKEVVQSNRFLNSGTLKELVDNRNYTFLKSPAGIFTEATLPIEDVIAQNGADTLNSVKVTFTNYNTISETNKPYKMPLPGTVLMVRKKDMHTFFEKNQLPDNITSFTASNSKNQYVFNNINRLVTTCINEKTDGISKDPDWIRKNPDWDKIVLIPVTLTQNTSSTSVVTVAVRHDLKMTSARLEGGLDGPKLDMEVIYSKLK